MGNSVSWRRIRPRAVALLSCALAILFATCLRRDREWRNVPLVELAILDTFPHSQDSEQSERIWQGVDIETEPDGRVYVADAGSAQVHAFDPAGGYLGSFGRKGQGPGEFTFPHALAVTPGRIFVKDRGGLIKFFDAQWRYRSQLRQALPFAGFAARDDRTLYACRLFPVDPERREEALDDPAIMVLDEAGAIVGSFGKPVPLVKDMNILNMAHVALDESGGIYVAYEYIPLIRKYSSSGQLLKENELPYDFIAEYRKENERTYGTSSYYRICPDIKSDGGRVFVMCLDRSIVRFLEMDQDLGLRRIYRLDLAPLGENIRSHSFALGVKDGQRRFYLLDGGDLRNLVYVAGPR